MGQRLDFRPMPLGAAAAGKGGAALGQGGMGAGGGRVIAHRLETADDQPEQLAPAVDGAPGEDPAILGRDEVSAIDKRADPAVGAGLDNVGQPVISWISFSM